MKNKRSCVALLLVLAFVGCTTNQVVSNLELVLAGVEAVFPALASAANLPPTVTQQVSTYLGAVSSATNQASAILAGPGTSAQKSAMITSAFAGIAKPLLPPGTAMNVVSAIDNVAQAVAKFLSAVQPAATKTGRASQDVVPVSAADQARLAAIGRRSGEAAVKARALVK